MAKQSDFNKQMFGMFVGIALLLTFILELTGTVDLVPGFGQASVVGEGSTLEQAIVTNAQCPDDGDTSLVFQVHNNANATGDETYDVTAYLFDGSGTIVQTITDTTAPTAFNENCGADYTLEVVSTDGANGDNSRIKKVVGPGSVSDGVLEFTTTGSNMNFEVFIDQQATLEGRAFSKVDNAFLFDDGDASATDYDTDGITYTSTTDNATAYTETNGIDIEFQVRAVQTDTNWNDFGTYLLLEMPTATWAEPTVWINGAKVTDMKDDLNSDESKAWAGYEYAYFVDADIYDGGEGATIRVAVELADGVASATADPEFDISARGAYLSTDGTEVKRGGVQDDASQTVVRTVFDMALDVTE